jgi:hypothetical protein
MNVKIIDTMIELFFMKIQCRVCKKYFHIVRAILSFFGGNKYVRKTYLTCSKKCRQNLFECSHPIFGKAIADKPITPKEAFNLGVKMIKAFKEKE